MTIQLKRNDTKDTISYILSNQDGSAVNLTGASVRFVMGTNKTLITNSPATVVDAVTGEVEYQLTDADTLVAGTHKAEFEVTFSDGKIKTFPNKGYILVTIQANVDKDMSTYVEDAIALRVSDIAVFKAEMTAIMEQASADAATANTMQSQINTLVLNGDSSPAAAQAAVDAKGVDKGNLKQRLDDDYNEVKTSLAEKASQIDLDTTNSNVNLKADKTEVQAIASGSPKGTYATLSALQTAFPTGNANIYLVTADGKWYYWNGSAWTAGGVYQATGISSKGVSSGHISDNLTKPFKGYRFNIKPVANDLIYIDFVFKLSDVVSQVTTSDKYRVLMDIVSETSNVGNCGFLFYYNNSSTPGNVGGGTNNISWNVDAVLSQDAFTSIDATKHNFANTIYQYVHVLCWIDPTDNAVFNKINTTDLTLMIGAINVGSPVAIGFYMADANSTKTKIKYFDKQLLSYANTIDAITKDSQVVIERDTNINNLIKENVDSLSDKVTYSYTSTTSENKDVYLVFQFDINDILNTLGTYEKYEFMLNFYSDNVEVVTLGAGYWANNNSSPGTISGGATDAAEYPISYTPGKNVLYYQSREISNKIYRYVKFAVKVRVNNSVPYTEVFYICNPKLRIGSAVLSPSTASVLYATTATLEHNIPYPASIITKKAVDSSLANAVSNITVVSKWAGKVWDAMGDSITDKNNVSATLKYGEIVASKVGCTINNYGIGGTGLLTDGANPYLAMYKRITDMNTNADLITVFGGTNDWDADLFPLGIFGDAPADSPTTIYGCLDLMCRSLITRFPTKIIAFFTPLPRNNNRAAKTQGYTLDDLSNAIIKVCGKYSIPVLDLYHNSNMYPENANFRAALMTDGLHPNDAGHLILADKVLSFINSL
jgi:lysophospholipase L1-like esterase